MKKNIVKTFSFMFSATLMAKILGLLRNIIFADCYGTGIYATSFFTASRIPTQLLDITLGAAISSTFIPVFNEFLQKDGKKRAIQFANHFLNVIIIISTILCIVGIVFAPTVVRLIAPNLEIEAFDTTVMLTRILFPIMIFTAVAFVFVGFLQSMDEFNIPAIISVVSNGILILYLLLFNHRFGIMGVAVAMVIGWLTQVLVQLPSAKKKGFEYHLKTDFKEEGLKRVVVLALPILISSWVQPINNIVNLRFASGLEEGRAVPAIEYAYTLYLIIIGVFSYSISNIIFPELSKLRTDQNHEKIQQIIKTAFQVTVLFVLPMAVGLFFLSKNLIYFVYERGEFTAESTLLTSKALKFYTIGMIGYAMMELFHKLFYSFQDSKTPMLTSLFAIILNITCCFVLVNQIGYIGLPLAASITSLLTASLLILFAREKLNVVFEQKVMAEIAKYLVATGIMATLLYLIHLLSLGILVEMIVSILVGGVSYFAVLIGLNSQMVRYGIELFLKKKNEESK